MTEWTNRTWTYQQKVTAIQQHNLYNNYLAFTEQASGAPTFNHFTIGQYTGNGTSSRHITTDVQAEFLMVFGGTGSPNYKWFKTSSMGNKTFVFYTGQYLSSCITEITTNGFVTGGYVYPNAPGVTYNYLIFSTMYSGQTSNYGKPFINLSSSFYWSAKAISSDMQSMRDDLFAIYNQESGAPPFSIQAGGVYTGDGSTQRFIEMGFAPTCIIAASDLTESVYAAMHLKIVPFWGTYSIGLYSTADYTTSAIYGYVLTENDAGILVDNISGPYFNQNGILYKYIAWRMGDY